MKVKFMQEGGQAPAPEAQAAPAAQPGPEQQIMEMANQIISQLGPEAATMLAQAILQMSQGGGQPAPTYARKGGKLVRIK